VTQAESRRNTCDGKITVMMSISLAKSRINRRAAWNRPSSTKSVTSFVIRLRWYHQHTINDIHIDHTGTNATSGWLESIISIFPRARSSAIFASPELFFARRSTAVRVSWRPIMPLLQAAFPEPNSLGQFTFNSSCDSCLECRPNGCELSFVVWWP